MKHLYKYEGVEQLIEDLLNMVENDSLWFSKGIMRDMDFKVTMTKDDIDKFSNDIDGVAFVVNDILSQDPYRFLGPNGMKFRIEEVESEQ